MTTKPPTWHNPSKADRKTFEVATGELRTLIGSYETIARKLVAHTGVPCSGATVRRWFLEQSLPVNWGLSLLEIYDAELDEVLRTGGGDPSLYMRLKLPDLFPWLKGRA